VLNKHLLLKLSQSSKRTRMAREDSLVIKRSLRLLRTLVLETSSFQVPAQLSRNLSTLATRVTSLSSVMSTRQQLKPRLPWVAPFSSSLLLQSLLLLALRTSSRLFSKKKRRKCKRKLSQLPLDLPSSTSRVSFPSRIQTMLRLTKISLIFKRSSQSRSRSMKPSLPARKVKSSNLILRVVTTKTVRERAVPNILRSKSMLQRKRTKKVMNSNTLKKRRSVVVVKVTEAAAVDALPSRKVLTEIILRKRESLPLPSKIGKSLILSLLRRPLLRRKKLRLLYPPKISRVGERSLSSELLILKND